MRLHFVLGAITLLLAFAAGVLSLRLRDDTSLPPADVGQIETAVRELRAWAKPVSVIDLSVDFPNPGRRELLDPSFMLPRSMDYARPALSALFRYVRSCSRGDRVASPPGPLRKAWVWHSFLCGAAELPEDFFWTGRLIHPGGGSFAAAALRTGRPEFATFEWLLRNTAYFHTRELGALVTEGKLTSSQLVSQTLRKLVGFDERVLLALARGERWAKAGDGVLLAAEDGARGENERSGKYEIYAARDWEERFGGMPVLLAASGPGAVCLSDAGVFCWQMNLDAQAERFSRVSLVLFGGSILLIALIGAYLWLRISSERRSEEVRRFAMQTIAHQLRTPLTSIGLSVEALREDFDRLGPAGQDAFLRITQDSQRLGRLARISSQFLASRGVGASLARPGHEIPSINAYLGELLGEEYREFEFRPASPDASLECDSRWVRLVLENLLDNAREHGQAPFSVTCEWRGPALAISVENGGSSAFASLQEMSKAFSKGPRSRGTGLGLGIVADVAPSLGARLEFQRSLVRFTLVFGRERLGSPGKAEE